MLSLRLIERGWVQNIHSEVAGEDTEIAALGVLADEIADFIFAHSAAIGDARNLKLGVARADVRIKSAAGSRHRIRRNILVRAQAVFFAIRVDAVLDRILQFLRSWSQVAAARIRGVVAVAGG